jgi:hypothetical protein
MQADVFVLAALDYDPRHHAQRDFFELEAFWQREIALLPACSWVESPH